MLERRDIVAWKRPIIPMLSGPSASSGTSLEGQDGAVSAEHLGRPNGPDLLADAPADPRTGLGAGQAIATAGLESTPVVPTAAEVSVMEGARTD
jgi:hypothetical protein